MKPQRSSLPVTEMVYGGISRRVARTFFEQGYPQPAAKTRPRYRPPPSADGSSRPINAGLVGSTADALLASAKPLRSSTSGQEVVRRSTTDRARQEEHTKGRPSINLASGIAVCGVCGGKMLASARGRERGRKQPKELPLPLVTQRIQGPSCVTRSRDLVDGFITNVILGYLELHRHEIASALGRLKAGAPVDSSADIAEAERIRRRLASLAELLASGTLGAADFAAATSKLRARLDVVESRSLHLRRHRRRRLSFSTEAPTSRRAGKLSTSTASGGSLPSSSIAS